MLALLSNFLWIIGASLLIWPWLAFAQFSAIRILGSQTGPKLPRWKFIGLLGVNIGVLWPVLMAAIVLRSVVVIYTLEVWLAVETTLLPWILGTAIGLVLTLGLLLVVFGVGLIVTAVWYYARKLTCDVCNTVQPVRQAVGCRCHHCRHPLATWPYVMDAADAES